MKALLISIFLTLPVATFTQKSEKEKRTDEMARKIITWLNGKHLDEIYMVFDSAMEKTMSFDTWKKSSQEQLYPLLPVAIDKYLNTNGGSNFYLLKTSATPWTMQVAVNDQNQLRALYFAPRQTQHAIPVMNTNEFWHDNTLLTATDSMVHRIIMKQIEQTKTPGMSIGILKGLKAYFYNYGDAKRRADLHPMRTTLFETGSLTKTFTAFILADAVVNNKVKLDEPITNFLPGNVASNKDLQAITLLQLANHTSGLPRLPGNISEGVKNKLDPYADYDSTKLFKYLQSFKLQHKPGEQYEYSNLGFGLLGVIMERVYQRPLEELYAQIIFKPFKMNNTYAGPVRDSSITATGYNEQRQITPYWNFKSMTGAGSIKSTTEDLLKYAFQFTLKPRTKGKTDGRIELLEKITYDHQPNSVSLAWHFKKTGTPEQIMWHNGGTYGFRSEMFICASKQLAVVALCNSGQEPGAAVAAKEIIEEMMK